MLRMDEGNKVKQTMKMEVRGICEKGRPRMGWMDNIRHDMNKGWFGGGRLPILEKMEEDSTEP